GPNHPNVAHSLNNLAVLYAAKGDIAKAVTFQSRANDASEYNLAVNLDTLSERQKLTYLDTLSKQNDLTISLHVRYAPNDPVARNLATTLILQRKGRALDAISENVNALRTRFNVVDRDLLDQWIGTRSQIARLVLDGPQRTTAAQYRDQI